MNTKDALIAARKLIENPDDWSNYGWGRGGKRCAAHAIADATGLDSSWSAHPAYRKVADAMGCSPIGTWNDNHTHAEVLAAFDKAIAAT